MLVAGTVSPSPIIGVNPHTFPSLRAVRCKSEYSVLGTDVEKRERVGKT